MPPHPDPDRSSGLLIREAPATELTVAMRIVARAGALAPDGFVAMRVGVDVVYLPRRGVSALTMTPYDVAAMHIADHSALVLEPPDDAPAYLDALRHTSEGAAVARERSGSLVAAPSVRACVAALLGRPYEELEAEARVTGALFGAHAIADE